MNCSLSWWTTARLRTTVMTGRNAFFRSFTLCWVTLFRALRLWWICSSFWNNFTFKEKESYFLSLLFVHAQLANESALTHHNWQWYHAKEGMLPYEGDARTGGNLICALKYFAGTDLSTTFGSTLVGKQFLKKRKWIFKKCAYKSRQVFLITFEISRNMFRVSFECKKLPFIWSI